MKKQFCRGLAAFMCVAAIAGCDTQAAQEDLEDAIVTGAVFAPTGGTPTSTGGAPTGTGGDLATGGVAGTGAVPAATGGDLTTGGATGTGAVPAATGGDLATGGMASTGGTPATGGTIGGGQCTGKPGQPGTMTKQIQAGGRNRSFIVHIPTNLDPNSAAPIVFMHHGWTMSGQVMFDMTDLPALADQEGFVAVFPDGGGSNPWGVSPNSGPVCGAGDAVKGATDDIAFVKAMIEDIKQKQCIDDDAVFVTGFSMGGYFSNHMGCQAGDFVKAIAPHSGGTYTGNCSGTPTPVMIVHGSGDGLIGYDCGTGARDLWVQRNGCSAEYESRSIKGGTCQWHKGCPVGGQVVLCTLDGMAHGWAGAPNGLGAPNGTYGGGATYESATTMIWDFFKQQID